MDRWPARLVPPCAATTNRGAGGGQCHRVRPLDRKEDPSPERRGHVQPDGFAHLSHPWKVRPGPRVQLLSGLGGQLQQRLLQIAQRLLVLFSGQFNLFRRRKCLLGDFIPTLLFVSGHRMFRVFPVTPSSFCPSGLPPEPCQGLLPPRLLLLPSTPGPPPSPARQDLPRNLSGTSATVAPPPTTSHLPPSPTLSPSPATGHRSSRALPFRTPTAPTVRRGATAPCPRAPASTATRSGMSGILASLPKAGSPVPCCPPLARLRLTLTATLRVRSKSPQRLC